MKLLQCSTKTHAGFSQFDMTQQDDKKSLDEAKKELEGVQGRPFDVDKVLAQDRARKERAHEVSKQIEEKLEKEHVAARLRRHELRAAEVEMEHRALEEKQEKFESEKRVFDKKGTEKGQDEKGGIRHSPKALREEKDV